MRIAVSSNWLDLPKSFLSDLFSRATSEKLRAGDVLFEAGDEGNGRPTKEVGRTREIRQKITYSALTV